MAFPVDAENYFTFADLMARGWSEYGVRKHLGAPDIRTKRARFGIRPATLYRRARVLAAEARAADARADRQRAALVGRLKDMKPVPGYTREEWAKLTRIERMMARRFRYR